VHTTAAVTGLATDERNPAKRLVPSLLEARQKVKPKAGTQGSEPWFSGELIVPTL